jgi:O-antigen/teichoic acid export membrane protein
MRPDSRRSLGAALSPGARQFTRNSAWGTIGGLLAAVSSVLGSVIVAHVLGVAGTGEVAFAMWIAMLAAAVVDLGVQASLARYLPELTVTQRPDAVRELAAMLWRWLAGSCLVALAAFAGWALYRWQTARISAGDAVLWMLIGFACVLQALAGFTFGYLRGIQRFDRLAALTGVFVAAQLAGIALGSLYFGAAGAVAGYCAGSAAPAVLSGYYARPSGAHSPELAARVRRYALFAWAAALSGTFVWSRVELFFLQHWFGNEAVGLFTVAVTLANLASQGPMLLTAGLLPYFAANFGKGATGEMKAAYATATRVLAFIVLPTCFGTAALLPVALPLVYGEAFAGAVPAATVLLLAAGIGATASVGTTLVMAMDRSDFVFASGLVSAILAIAAGFVVIPAFGLMGAVWSRAAIQVAAVAMGGGFVFWRLRFPLPLVDLARLLLAAAICGLTARAVLTLSHNALVLIPAIGAGALSYAVTVRLLGALHPGDAERLRTLCGVFPERVRAGAERVIDLLAPGLKAAVIIAAPPRRSAGDAN